MKFTEAEKQTLIAIKWLSRRKAPDRKKLEESKKDVFGNELVEWNSTLEKLIERRLVCETEEGLVIAEKIEDEANSLLADWSSKGFSEWMIQSERSRAYSKFCERLYGKDLCQCSMMNMKQLDTLLQVLALGEKNKVLELGCGIGTITEYISDVTGVEVIGVDIAKGAIERARERTAEKSKRLVFEIQNMDNLNFQKGSFDTIICIDALYFVNDLDAMIIKCKDILKADGQMGFFYTQVNSPDDPKDFLNARETKLAQVLNRQKLAYKTWDYTEDERAHWRRSKEIAEDLKTEFEKEGNIELYESRIKESDKLLEVVNDNRISRYLYHVKL